MQAESIRNLSQACMDAIVIGVLTFLPTPPKSIAKARGRKDWLLWCKALDEELERRIPRQLHTYDFVDSLPIYRPILYTLYLK